MITTTALSARGQALTVLHTFSGYPTDGVAAYIGGQMALSSNTLFGITQSGGSFNNGTIFSINTDGSSYRILCNFNIGGSGPLAEPVLSGNTLYGTAQHGSNGSGIVYAVDTGGSNFTVLHTFARTSPSFFVIQPTTVVTNSDGAGPYGELLLLNTRLYGTTSVGGSNASGTIFSLNTNGTDFQVLHTFAVNGYGNGGTATNATTNADGYFSMAGLVSDGLALYGTTREGGTNDGGVVFSIGTDGSNFTLLHVFSKVSPEFGPPLTNSDGNIPPGLTLSGNVLYGATIFGSTNHDGAVFAVGTDGANFRILHSFSLSEGRGPGAALLPLGDKLYGTTVDGTSNGSGSIYSLNNDGSDFQVLYKFSPVPGGAPPGTNAEGAFVSTGLAMSGNNLFATSQSGGALGDGTIVSLQLPVAFTGITNDPDGSATLAVSGTPFLNYLIQAAPGLASPIGWQTIWTNTAGADGTFQFTDTNAPAFPSRFYRSLLVSP